MKDDWPDLRIAHEWPQQDDVNEDRWQHALDAALAKGTLAWVPTEDSDIYRLTGDCPRCGHTTEQSVEVRFIRGLDRVAAGWVRFNFDCACATKHVGAGEDDVGCGWGGPLAVVSTIPGARP